MRRAICRNLPDARLNESADFLADYNRLHFSLNAGEEYSEAALEEESSAENPEGSLGLFSASFE